MFNGIHNHGNLRSECTMRLLIFWRVVNIHWGQISSIFHLFIYFTCLFWDCFTICIEEDPTLLLPDLEGVGLHWAILFCWQNFAQACLGSKPLWWHQKQALLAFCKLIGVTSIFFSGMVLKIFALAVSCSNGPSMHLSSTLSVCRIREEINTSFNYYYHAIL